MGWMQGLWPSSWCAETTVFCVPAAAANHGTLLMSWTPPLCRGRYETLLINYLQSFVADVRPQQPSAEAARRAREDARPPRRPVVGMALAKLKGLLEGKGGKRAAKGSDDEGSGGGEEEEDRGARARAVRRRAAGAAPAGVSPSPPPRCGEVPRSRGGTHARSHSCGTRRL